MVSRKVSRPSGPDDQHVRRAGRCFLPLRILLFLFPGRGQRGVLAQHVDRGLVDGQHLLGRQRPGHRLLEPAIPDPRRQPRRGLIHPPGRDRHPQQHAHDERGTLGRNVPVAGQQHRRGIQHHAVGHRARVCAGRRIRERDRPAARAHQPRQRPLRHLPDHVHVDDLRPARLRGQRRAVQARLAAAALRRRLRGLPLAWIRIPGRALALMPGLPAPLAVLPPLPLRFLPPRPPRLLRPDPLLR